MAIRAHARVRDLGRLAAKLGEARKHERVRRVQQDAAVLASVRSQILAGYNPSSPTAGDGTWNGTTGITSSSIGSLNASIVHPREVFLPAILHSAASVVLVHNHPSGDPEPSEEDLTITRRLVEVGELVGIQVLDHVIVAGRGAVSLRARQLM